MNPGMPPMSAPPPPPPSQGSSALKWVLIGCGCILFFVIAFVGGCVLLVGYGVKKGAEWAREIEEGGPRYIRANSHVQSHLGPVTDVQLGANTVSEQPPGQERFVLPYTVTGEKASGRVELEFRMDGLTPKPVGGTLFVDGLEVNLKTGAETKTKVPDPPPQEPEEDK